MPSNNQGLEQERKVETSSVAAVELPPPQAIELKEADSAPAKENAPVKEDKSGETSQVGEVVRL